MSTGTQWSFLNIAPPNVRKTLRANRIIIKKKTQNSPYLPYVFSKTHIWIKSKYLNRDIRLGTDRRPNVSYFKDIWKDSRMWRMLNRPINFECFNLPRTVWIQIGLGQSGLDENIYITQTKIEWNAKSRVWNEQRNMYRSSLSTDSFWRWPGKSARSESESHWTAKELTNTSGINS